MNKSELKDLVNTFSKDEYRVFSLIGVGEENRTYKSALTSYTGFSVRKIKEIIKSLRYKGIPVCSQVQNGGGYWIEWNKKNFGRFVYEMKNEVEGYKKSLDKMIEIYKSLKGKDSNELFL